MFKKTKRVFRGKRSESDSDENDPVSNITSDSAPVVEVNNGIKHITKNVSSNSMLSFNHEEEGEVFQVKKPSFSRKYIKQLKREMEKEKPTLADATNKPQDSNDTSSEEEKDNFNDNINHQDNDNDKIVTGIGDEDDAVANEANDDQKNKQHFHDIIKSGAIPDANLIHMARKQRQLARENADSYIPLDDTQRYQKSSSRLIRDDDNDASDSDADQGTLALTLKQKDAERKKLEERILAAEEESDGTDQEREWEEQQIKKGTSIPTQIIQPPPPNAGDFYYGSVQSHIFTRGQAAPKSKKLMNILVQNATPAQTVKNDYATFDLPKEKTISERLDDLIEQNKKHVDELEEISSRIELTRLEINENEDKRQPLEHQYKFFQEMRTFARDYVDCMNEKMTSVNYIERCLLELLANKSEKYVKRRQSDINEQSLEYTAGKCSDLKVDVPQLNKNKADREARRARRKRAREMKGIQGHLEGMSTDDELINSEMSKFNTEKERLLKDSKTLFNDVVEDYCTLVNVKKHFERWKLEYWESYDEAYIGLCLTKTFLPIIKPIVVAWNPLEDGSEDFEQMEWYQTLMFYSVAEDAREMRMDDADLKLLPNIVDKILMPHLIDLVKRVWDPLSMKQSINLTNILKKLVNEYPNFTSENANTQLLISSVIIRIRKCLDDDIFVPLYPKVVLENRSSGSSIFFHRQFVSCVKLFVNINLWTGILSVAQMQSLSLDSLLNRYIMVASTSIPITLELISIFQTLSKSIPKDWFSDTKNDCTIPKLENFAKLLIAISKHFQERKMENRELLKSIGFMLVNMHAINYALAVFTILGCRTIPDK